jgi:hypothetical protein
MTTLRPGTWANQASRLCECCAAAPGTRAGGRADHQRHLRGAAEHEVDLRGLVDDLVHRAGDEVGELQLDDGPHPAQGGPDPGADDGDLGDRGVAHPLAAERSSSPVVTPKAPP